MELSDYIRQDATGLKALLDRGEVTAAELRESALRALESCEAELNAIVHGPFEDAEPADLSGPFGGVPFVVKDLACAMAGRPFEMGSRLLQGNVATADTTLMARFRRAGLVTLARTATPEFGFNANTAPVVNGPTRNPWDTGRIPGGSSGGSAALVAARAVPMAHASDGGGSIRIPASCTGLVGLKPSRGRITPGPDFGERLGGLAVEFALTRSVRDAAGLLDAVSGPSPGDKYYVRPAELPQASVVGTDPGRLRVALRTDPFWGSPADPEVVAATEAAAATLEGLGHAVEPAAPPLAAESFLAASTTIWTAYLAATAVGIRELLGREAGADNVETATWAAICHGLEVTAVDLVGAFAVQNDVTRSWGAFLDEYDLFLCPTLAEPPLPVGSLNQNDPRHTTVESWLEEAFPATPYTPVFNMTGQPSMSLPLGMSSDGLPIGVMLGAQALREDVLLAVAAQLEEAVPWSDRLPSLHAGAPAMG